MKQKTVNAAVYSTVYRLTDMFKEHKVITKEIVSKYFSPACAEACIAENEFNLIADVLKYYHDDEMIKPFLDKHKGAFSVLTRDDLLELDFLERTA